MFCKKCGKQIENNSLFCSNCGSRQKANKSANSASHGRTNRVKPGSKNNKAASYCCLVPLLALAVIVTVSMFIAILSPSGTSSSGKHKVSVSPTAASSQSSSKSEASPAAKHVDASPDKPAIAESPSYKVGSFVAFGRYKQGFCSDPEPIEWLVLENDGKQALLVSKYSLDCKSFNLGEGDGSWRECYLRKWLNDDFFNIAFNSEEQNRIVESVLFTGDTHWEYLNKSGITKGCGETRDKVFCLSIEEAKKYFPTDNKRQCWPTRHTKEYNDKPWYYWLRSPGAAKHRVAVVESEGSIYSFGEDANFKYNMPVRPALRIKLK